MAYTVINTYWRFGNKADVNRLFKSFPGISSVTSVVAEIFGDVAKHTADLDDDQNVKDNSDKLKAFEASEDGVKGLSVSDLPPS